MDLSTVFFGKSVLKVNYKWHLSTISDTVLGSLEYITLFLEKQGLLP